MLLPISTASAGALAQAARRFMMLRWIRIPLGLAVILFASGGAARAQYGWGWGGWGGWGETPEGSAARGLGVLYSGLGQFNEQTAIANSINEDTWQRWNQYLYLSNEEATRKYMAKKNFDIQKNKDSYNAIIKRLQDNPTAKDVTDGDALNAALDQLSDPRIQGSSLRMASTPIDAKIIAEIPFRYASEAVTIILSQVKGATKWPTALDGPQFADDKKEFESVAEQARKEDEDGEISPQTLGRAHTLVAQLRAKLEASPLPDSRENQAALRFVKMLAGLVRLLEKPDTREALDQLRMVKNTTVGNLIGFMHVYNLRFGAATTPRQKIIYEQIYPVLDQARDRVISEAKLDNTPAPEPGHVGDFFSKMPLDQLEGKNKKNVPKPPNPEQ
jgi:hypothetical protein